MRMSLASYYLCQRSLTTAAFANDRGDRRWVGVDAEGEVDQRLRSAPVEKPAAEDLRQLACFVRSAR